MYLEEFFDYKNKFIEHILTDEKIVGLINDSFTVDNAPEMVYSQIYPFEHIPDTVEEAKTFICVDVDIKKTRGKTYYYPVLNVWVFTHDSLQRLPGGGVRVDKLCSEICRKIGGSFEYGLGALELESVNRFAPTLGHIGKWMVFIANDFNMTYNPNKYIPSNRKGV